MAKREREGGRGGASDGERGIKREREEGQTDRQT